MSDLDPLARQFALDYADEVARLAEDENTDELAEFLAKLPPQAAAAVAARLTSRQLSGLFDTVSPELISRMLIEGQHADMVSILAHLPPSRYDGVLAATGESHRADLRRRLDFPAENLAAIASTNFVRTGADTLCGSLKRELESADGDTERPIFVVGDDGRYQGMLSPFAVIANRNVDRPVSALYRRVEPLRGSMPVTSAASAPQWREYSALPVVDGPGYLLGAITETELWRAIGKRHSAGESFEGLVSEIAGGYLSVCAELLETAVGGRRQ